ncbi:Transcriptional regulatory protein WalR [Bacillus sp. THAF10]|uniref:response regulator transcription factor n=1 Tax=Bacillus sp. THAF10 TaxID=2587848 RepID=UPI0012A822C8|nr:response regulator transcription factor [Bacillus sp. THAF10]QFT89274.1 Transcriptional regulatory protein WalR [Bacillus sp. THAF10]
MEEWCVCMHVFVVDDEKNIRDILEKYLVNEGYKVTLFSKGEQVVSEIQRLSPDLIVLDIMMPGMDGLELCKDIRKRSEIPIIFVSAKDEEFDRILGLEIGGDDYLTKPFSPRELIVRIKNIIKRMNKTTAEETLVIRDVNLIPARRYLECAGEEVVLTMREYDLFAFLALHKEQPFTREHLIEKICGYDFVGDGRIIDDLVKRIRKKLSQHGSSLEITTIWGYGYRMDD